MFLQKCSKNQFLYYLLFSLNLAILSSSIIGNNVQNKIQRSFKIDYENNVFLKDGRPFRYISGEIHYFRIHPSLWEKRLRQVRAAGLNAIQFYIPWNFHETKPNSFNFDGDRNVVKFLRLAQQNEMDVLLRIGPYICSEWEFGGLPWWLISKGRNGTVGPIRIRTSDERYLHYVARYFSILLPMLKPWLHKNGGPILMLQIENEYGHVPSLCDHSYMRWLRDTVWTHLGKDVVLYTTDGFYTEQMGICGTIEGVFPTIDFGIDQTEEMIKANFVKQKKHSAGKGPSVNSEFWTMWVSMWGESGVLRQQIGPILETMDAMWAQNASFSFFLFHGGTNFGFWSGRGLYFGKPGMVTTSYDFGAAINEAGQTTPLYETIRHWIQNLGSNWPNPPLEIPPNPRGIAVDPIAAIRLPNFIKTLNASSIFMPNDRCQISERIPLNFEQLDGPFQFVLYSTELDIGGTQLTIPHFRDMAYLFLDGKYQGTILENNAGLAISARMGQRLDILVESTGRRTYPLAEIDPKGILSVVLFDGKPAGQTWLQCGIDMDAMYANAIDQFLQQKTATSMDNMGNVAGQISNGPLAIYVAKFSPIKGIDWANGHTFFDSRGWGRGAAFFNGFNIGRYWPQAGPQTSLFIPGALMKRENEWNFMVLLELDDVEDNEGKNKQIHFLAEPIVKYSDKPFPPVD